MNRGRVECSYSELDRIMYKGVKLTKKGVLGVHQAVLLAVGLAFKIGEIRVHDGEFRKLLKTKEGKTTLKRFSAGATAVITLLGTAAAINEISRHIPEASAATTEDQTTSVVEEAGDLDLDSRYGKYDIANEVTLDNSGTVNGYEQGLDDVVTILHNADGSDYSAQILSSTGQKLNAAGINYYYASNNDELINSIKTANASGEKVNIVSIENGMNDYDQTLIASQYIRGQEENAPMTNSRVLAAEIVDNAPYNLYTNNGVASNIVEGERQPGSAQQTIINERLEGEKLLVDTLITVRPSSKNYYSPDRLGGDIADGIVGYYAKSKNEVQRGPKL